MQQESQTTHIHLHSVVHSVVPSAWVHFVMSERPINTTEEIMLSVHVGHVYSLA